jgi:hypothetical protein
VFVPVVQGGKTSFTFRRETALMIRSTTASMPLCRDGRYIRRARRRI